MKEFVKKLIGRLEEYQNQLDTDMWARECDNWYGQLCNGKSEGVDEIIEIVNQLAEEMGVSKMENTTWIPCSERLPEKYGEYLCCDTYGNFVLGFPSESNTSNTGFVVETEHEYCYDIIAWQPLPEPYQKGE